MNLFLVLVILVTAHETCSAPPVTLMASKTAGQNKVIPITVPESETAYITSPDYPESYENNLNLEYIITGAEGHYLAFQPEHWDTEPHFDILTLSEDVHAGKRFIGNFDWGYWNDYLESYSNVVRAVFRSDGSVVGSGFRIAVHAYPINPYTPPPNPEPTPAPEVVELYVNESETRFTSPGYPAPYGSNQQVHYHITAPEGHKIQFHAECFDVEERIDTLIFYDYVPGQGLYFIESLSNHTEYAVLDLVSRSNLVHALFHTDGSVELGGFSILARSIPATVTPPPITPQLPTGSQDVELAVGETGLATFTSPGYPEPYANNLAVSYHITGPPGRHLQLDVDYLEIESCCDLLQILHRDDENGNSWIRLTALSAGDPVIVNDNSALVYFRSDSSVAAGGFSIRVSSIPAGV